MHAQQVSLRHQVRFVLVATLFLGAGPTSSARAEEAKGQLQEVSAPPAGCQELGEVEGKDFAAKSAPSEAEARKEAWKEAEKLGATHLKVIFVGRSGQYEAVYTAMSYRCPAVSTPSTGK
jgi:hypothetical protein